MQIIENILGCISALESQRADLNQQLRVLHWEDDELSTQILQANLYAVEKQLVIASMVNCTPHPITIEGLGELPPSGILPRVILKYEDDLPIQGVRVRSKHSGAVAGLPEPVEGLSFIVSGMVRDALNHEDALSALPEFQSRPDVYAPDAIRNDHGHIVAVRGLVQ